MSKKIIEQTVQQKHTLYSKTAYISYITLEKTGFVEVCVNCHSKSNLFVSIVIVNKCFYQNWSI